MGSSRGSAEGAGAHSLEEEVEPAHVERIRLENLELVRRARSFADRLRRIDLILETTQPDPAADALVKERDQVSRVIARNNSGLSAAWDRIRFPGCKASVAPNPSP
jgi:hypothetical protein